MCLQRTKGRDTAHAALTPVECDVEDGTCEELAAEYRFSGLMTHDAALHYKYVVDV